MQVDSSPFVSASGWVRVPRLAFALGVRQLLNYKGRGIGRFFR